MKNFIKRLDHLQICIPTGAEDQARAFYTDLLHLQEIPKPKALQANGGLWYQLPDIQLHIGTENHTPKSKKHPAFEVENLEEIRKYLEEKEVPTKDATAIPNIRRFYVYDPFDNRIEFLEKLDKNQ